MNTPLVIIIINSSSRWGRLWSNRRVITHGDNQAAMQIINKGTTANAMTMQELRALFWLSAFYNFPISTVYLKGTKNTLVDAISRLHRTVQLLLIPLRCIPARNHTEFQTTCHLFAPKSF